MSKWFRKRKKGVPLAQLCYDVAYFILPHYVYNDLAKIEQLCLKLLHSRCGWHGNASGPMEPPPL
jgi:hypothetical protein